MRIEYQHPTEKKSLSIGTDQFLEPGDSSIKTFLQVWDMSNFDQPCNEGAGGFNNILVSETDVDMERMIEVINQYGFDVPPVDLFQIHNETISAEESAVVDNMYPRLVKMSDVLGSGH